MLSYEHRRKFICILYERRFDTVSNLAFEFCVCKHHRKRYSSTFFRVSYLYKIWQVWRRVHN